MNRTTRCGTAGFLLGTAFGGAAGITLGPYMVLGVLGALMGSVLGTLIGRALELEENRPHF